MDKSKKFTTKDNNHRESISIDCELRKKPASSAIQLKKVIAVEGQDEVHLLNVLLGKMDIRGVEVREVGGVNKFPIKIPALVRTSGFSDVEVFAIIRDADENAELAFQSVKNLLAKEEKQLKLGKLPDVINQFSNGNPKIGIFIMPGNSTQGMLENLCLKSIKNHPVMECVNDFIKCATKKVSASKKPKNLAKAKVQVFLAVMHEIVCSVGLAAEKGYWEFDSEEFDELKLFLNNLK